MIIYRPNQPPLLSDYGIKVPMLKGRAEKVYEEIRKKFGDHFFSDVKYHSLEREDFLRAHTPEFLKRCEERPEEVLHETFELINEDGTYNRYDPSSAGKPLSHLVEVFRESCDISYGALLEAFKHGFSYYLGGGFHHSLADRGRGFCLFNDIVISARKFQQEVQNGTIWVIDLDAHKGCGTAAITKDDPSILTLSVHMKEGWPLDSDQFDKDGSLNPWFIPSTVDIGISRGEEGLYLSKLKEGLEELSQHPLPQICIVVDGSDPFEEDALPSAGLLKLTRGQCLERNMVVYDFLREKRIPQAYLMSGGYGDQNWIIHYQFLALVLENL